MSYFDKKSILKSDIIKKVLLNEKDYKYLDFDFKIIKKEQPYVHTDFQVEVHNHNFLILTLAISRAMTPGKYWFRVIYFNPQTDNDCYSINHIIAVCSEMVDDRYNHEDNGNSDIISNQFIFRKRESFYSFVKIWTRGAITENNYDKLLSYEFATDEYIGYIKHLFMIKKMPRRKLKKLFEGYLNKLIVIDKLNEND